MGRGNFEEEGAAHCKVYGIPSICIIFSWSATVRYIARLFCSAYSQRSAADPPGERRDRQCCVWHQRRWPQQCDGWARLVRGGELAICPLTFIIMLLPHCGTMLVVYIYKCLHGLAPKYLADLCVPVAEVAGRRQLRSACRGLLDLPRFNMSNYGRRAFSFAGPHTCNLLPDQLRTSASLATFKRSLKTFLFEQITHWAH